MIRFVRAAAVAVVILASSTLAAAQDPYDAGDWKTVVYPIHAWLPVFGGEVRLPDVPDRPGLIPSAKTSGTFNGAVMSGVRVERRRLSVEGEFLWAGMSGSVTAPRFNLDVNTFAVKAKGGFEVAPALYIDGGVRWFTVNMTASILDFPVATWKPGFWEAVIGTTFRPRLSEHLRLFTQADLGGIGDDTHRTVTATANLEWMPVRHLAIGAGYGLMYLRTDGTILSKPVHLTQTLNGPMLTIGIPF